VIRRGGNSEQATGISNGKMKQGERFLAVRSVMYCGVSKRSEGWRNVKGEEEIGTPTVA
jgi:hypothetical protein